jgi:1-phosphofructokinase family hexose kinase
MIYTVTLNPTIDRTLTVPGFAAGGTFKATASGCLAAGKGINVARVVATLDEPVTALGIVGEHDAAVFAATLDELGVENRLLPVAGATRNSVTVLDPTTGAQTHLREQGFAPPVEALARVEAALHEAGPGDWVVLSGSLPPGVPDHLYRTLVRVCNRQGAHALLDANGPALLCGVSAPPTLLKPNLFELWQVDRGWAEVTAERDLSDVPMGDVLVAAQRVQAQGISMVVVSLGAQGVLGLEEGRAWRAWTVLDRPVVDAVGSGDALAAGLVVAMARKQSFTAALRLGVACGAANALVAGAGCCRRADIERLVERAQVEEAGNGALQSRRECADA